MTPETEILTAEFPLAVRGYSQVAVDDFVRQIGNRLQAMQALLDERSEVVERQGAALVQAKQELTAFKEREAALMSAMLAVEQRKVSVEQDLDSARQTAQTEAEGIVSAAKKEADGLLSAARRECEEMKSLAESACGLQEERLKSLCQEYEDTAARIREVLEAHLQMLPTRRNKIGNGKAQQSPLADVALAAPVENGWVPVDAA